MERPKDQHPAHLHAIGKPLLPDKEEDGYVRGHLFLSFLAQALPLEVIKGEAGAMSKER
jgi:hypothetical protein